MKMRESGKFSDSTVENWINPYIQICQRNEIDIRDEIDGLVEKHLDRIPGLPES